MHTNKWLRAGINLSLAVILIVSCEKQGILTTPDSTGPSNKKTTDGLVLQPQPQPPFKILQWFNGPNLPLPTISKGGLGRFSMGSFAINGKGYLVAGGLMDGAGNQTSSTDVLCYDTATRAWSQKASFPGYARTGLASFAIGNFGYICTGVGANYSTDTTENWQYSSTKNHWTLKAPFGGVARSYGVGVALQGKGYVGTGAPRSGGADGGLNDWWQYDPDLDHWTQRTGLTINETRWGAVAFANDVPGGKAYITTGIQFPYWPGLRDCYEYDPVADHWTRMPDLPDGSPGRTYAVGMSVSQGGIIGTGYAGYNYNDFLEFNYTTKTWGKMPAMPGDRFLAQGFVIGDVIYVGGGLYGLGDNQKTPKDDFHWLNW
jgi:N-acetylneuraminic acid mutarotase